MTYPADAPRTRLPTVQALRPVFKVEARNNGGVSRYTSWALAKVGGGGSAPKTAEFQRFQQGRFRRKALKSLEIDYQSTSTDDRRGSESFGATLDPRD